MITADHHAARIGSRIARHLCALVAAGLLTFAAAPARAEPPSDAVWQAMKERMVVVEKDDGSTVTGKLIGVDASAVIVLNKAGEPVTVQRAAVRAVRGESTGADAAASPAPPTDVGPKGGVKVHIDSNYPDLQLFRVEAEGTFAVGTRVGVAAFFSPVCMAPCDQVVDGSHGESFFLQADGKAIGPRFKLHDRSGAGQVTLKADIRRLPRPWLLYGGIGVGTAGLAAAAICVPLAVQPNVEFDNQGDLVTTENKDAPVLWGIAGAGAAVIGAGVVMMIFSRGDYDVKVPGAASGISLRGFAFTPPVRVGPETLPASGSLSFTF